MAQPEWFQILLYTDHMEAAAELHQKHGPIRTELPHMKLEGPEQVGLREVLEEQEATGELIPCMVV